MMHREQEQAQKYKVQSPRTAALKISAVYLFCGALWILFSDQVLGALVRDKENFAYFSLIKGWLYIVMTAFLLFYLIYKATFRMSVAERKLHNQFTELLNSREELRNVAFQDQLTGLPNRLALYENLGLLKDVSLFYIDLDDFKYVNDSLGHEFGDQLVRAVSARLSEGLTESEQLYRLGGDEWVIVSRETEDRLSVRGEMLLGLFDHSFSVENNSIHMSGSIGVSRFPFHGRTLEQLLKNADIAMYQAKKRGKNGLAIYEESFSVPLKHRMEMERLLRQALQNGEFELHYQPQINLASAGVEGFEALIRWNSPVLGRVGPDQFIRIAEETQLIVPIGEWVLRTACEFIRDFHESNENKPSISVNVSVVQLYGHRFEDMVREVLAETGVDPHHLELEVTESMVIESLELIGDKLKRLSDSGVNIALDDFGRGFSSLSHLMKLPITTLKIDKSFVDHIPDNRDDNPLTGLVIQLAKQMGIKVVAEGVEKYAQLDYLKKYDCDCIQGYLFSKPLTAAEAKDWNKTTNMPSA
ncbi:putative bifunctional diguanylate cyclase/phosphodiesterase [Cohnella soli]|uniref:Bifunctional diguanylate cyclase/phosphodiesterase n=1 Tax=Cohnella soli TaxID=425005 RepID=A0ABW0I179_9BACL